MTSSEDSMPEVVTLDWKDVEAADTSADMITALEKALGPGGMGLVVIRNVPGFVEAKAAFLPEAHKLISLPQDYLENDMTDKDSLYNSGWSHGKEKLGDKPDFAKGSYYYNPVTDLPGSEEDRQNYPLSYPQNVWPSEDKIPGFKSKAVNIGLILRRTTAELCKHIDSMAASKVEGYPKKFLYDAMKDTEKAKARLLYYFPIKGTEGEAPKEDSWIGWHNDSGFLTALAGDMYVDHATGKEVPCPDSDAGLYVVDRSDRRRQVSIPKDCMAVQMGECTQIVTGGAVVATPHCVRGASDPSVARISLPCFIDTPPGFPMYVPEGATREQVLEAGLRSARVPPLESRWTGDGMTFGDFLQKTFEMYYDWSVKAKQ